MIPLRKKDAISNISLGGWIPSLILIGDGVKFFNHCICIVCAVTGVQKCYIGALEVYENPRTLTMLDLMEVNTYKLMDCDLAHHPKEIVQ